MSSKVFAAKTGASLATLEVRDSNEAAKRLYEKCGFREIGCIPGGCNYYGKYHDEIMMVKQHLL